MGHKKAFRVHQASSPPPLLDISQICYWLFIFFTHQEYFFYEILLCSADGKLHSSVSNNNKLSIQHRNAFNSNGFDCVVLLFRRQYTQPQNTIVSWFLHRGSVQLSIGKQYSHKELFLLLRHHFYDSVYVPCFIFFQERKSRQFMEALPAQCIWDIKKSSELLTTRGLKCQKS